MAYRLPARDMDHPESFDDDDEDPRPGVYFRASDKSRRTKCSASKPHLITTDFGIDTLARYMREEFGKQKLEKETKAELEKNDPLRVSCNSERESLQRLVNGKRLVAVALVNDRLLVQGESNTVLKPRWTYSGFARADLAPDPTLEFSVDTGDSVLGKMKEPSKEKHESESSHPDRAWPLTLEDLARVLSYQIPDGEDPDLDKMFDLFIGLPKNIPLTAAYKFKSLALKAMANIDEVYDGSDISVSSRESWSSSDDADDSDPSSGSTVESQPAEDVTNDTGCKAMKNASDTSGSLDLVSLNQHSHSFVKYAVGARQSTRCKEKFMKDFWIDSGDSSSADSDSSLPRKNQGSRSVSTMVTTSAVSANIVQHVKPLHGQGQDSDQVNGALLVSASQSQPSVNSSIAHVTNNDGGFACVGSEQCRAHSSKRPYSSSVAPDIDAFDVDEDLGTFCSAYSNETTSSGDNGHTTKAGQVQRDACNVLHSEVQKTAGERAKKAVVTVFDYDSVVPEKLPFDINVAHENCRRIWSTAGLDNNGKLDTMHKKVWYSSQFVVQELDPDGRNVLQTTNKFGYYPRRWKASDLPVSSNSPPICLAGPELAEFPPPVLLEIFQYLSTREIRKLRLVNRATANAVMTHMVRSTVIEFGPRLFASADGKTWNAKSDIPAPDSLLQAWGPDMNRFGISFEWDPVGLANAQHKTIEEEVHAWFGSYTWPTASYPRFPQLKEMEDLVDGNRPLLKNAMKSLVDVTELALAVDSGHGWLNGPDMSDLSMLRRDIRNGTRVFGRNYKAADPAYEFAIREYFIWAQMNTINAFAKEVANMDDARIRRMHRGFIRSLRVRPYESYRVRSRQPDVKKTSHVGGRALPRAGAPPPAPWAPVPAIGMPLNWTMANGQPTAAPAIQTASNAVTTFAQVMGLNNSANTLNLNAAPLPSTVPAPGGVPVAAPVLSTQATTDVFQTNSFINLSPLGRNVRYAYLPAPQRSIDAARTGAPVNPQWPLIFNCMNLSAQVGGNQDFIQEEVAHPATYPFMPGELTETHVQWLMETLWAQRAFIINYTNSIIANTGVFKKVQTLNIAKLSSGLIQSLSQRDFWAALPGLNKLILKVIPDWRQEHVPGDKMFYRNMLIPPVDASIRFAEVLKNNIAYIEHLSTLTIGFVGGGEHQTGMYARNRHVLPAPITCDPGHWVHEQDPDQRTMFVFNHIRNLTFENCWFTPRMLEVFMIKSRDTSLHHLTLDSVSLTGVHEERRDGVFSIAARGFECKHDTIDWLHEEIPLGACWVNTLENIVPGPTILDRRYEAGIIDLEQFPRPERVFRGNVEKITLRSCGYVRIGGTQSKKFSQAGVVEQSAPMCAVDEGLTARKRAFGVSDHRQPPTESTWFRKQYGSDGVSNDYSPRCIMMSEQDPHTGEEYFGLGTLTQCVHPVEKRVLEQAWDMRFGWGDRMERWAAVEDGWYEGGTGRFSGMIG